MTATPFRSLTEEIQVQGRFFDDRVRSVAGFYYSKDKPQGDWYGGFRPYNAAGAPSTAPAPQTSANGLDNSSKAIFGNIDLEIIEDRLTFHGGGRLTWDDALFCTLGSFTPPGTAKKACDNGVIATGSSKATTWSFGLDWQVTDDLFLYAATRRGYRSSGVRSDFVNTNACLAGQPSIYNANPGTCTNDFGVAATFTRGELATLQRNGVPITPIQLQAAATGSTIDLRPVAVREPETVTDVEVGMRSDWNLFGWRQRLNVTYFHYKYSNVLQTLVLGTPATNFDFLSLNTQTNGQPCPAATPRLCNVNQVGTTNGGITVNAGEAITDGVQASLRLMPVTGLTLDFSGSWIKQKGEGINIVDSEIFKQLPSSLLNAQAANQLFLDQLQKVPTSPTPEWSYSISARYVFPFHPGGSDIVLNYNYFWTDKWTDAAATYPSYRLHNMRLSWNRVAGSNVDLGFWVRNLTDKVYIQGSASASSHTSNFGEPRMMGFDLTLNFR